MGFSASVKILGADRRFSTKKPLQRLGARERSTRAKRARALSSVSAVSNSLLMKRFKL
ncbi:MAG: hypothetical protein NTW59_03030 [Candidatus Diapherotrites archaeon]|nr:hypothetical protein [Candidatus Diapherotrites archaeon]